MIAAIDNSHILRPWATNDDTNPFSVVMSMVRKKKRKKKIINILEKIKKSS